MNWLCSVMGTSSATGLTRPSKNASLRSCSRSKVESGWPMKRGREASLSRLSASADVFLEA